MVPMNFLPARRVGRLRRHRRVVGEGGEGSQEGRRRERRVRRQGRELHPPAEEGRAEADAGRRLRARHDERDDPRRRVPQDCRTSASATLVADTSSHMFSRPIDVDKIRADLRRRAEEHRAGGRDARDRPRRPGEEGRQRPGLRQPAGDAAVRHAHPGEVALQHAAGVHDLHDRPRDEVAGLDRRPRGDRQDQRAQGAASCTPRSTAPGSTGATRRRTAARG